MMKPVLATIVAVGLFGSVAFAVDMNDTVQGNDQGVSDTVITFPAPAPKKAVVTPKKEAPKKEAPKPVVDQPDHD